MKILILGLWLRKTKVGKSHHCRHVEKPRFRKNAMPAFLNSSGLKSIFKKAPFLVRISVDGGPNRRNKVAFSNFSGVVRTRP